MSCFPLPPLLVRGRSRGCSDLFCPLLCMFSIPDLVLMNLLEVWEGRSCYCEPFRCIGPACGSSFTSLEAVCGKQRLCHTELPHLSFHRSSWFLLAPLLTPPVPVVTAPPCSLCPEGAHRFQWIRNLVPEFGISSSHVKVLSSPAEFYELLKVSCGFQARKGFGNCSGYGQSQAGQREGAAAG